MTSIQAVPASAAAGDEVPILQLATVRAGYGRIDVLHGIDLELHAGGGVRTARPERRGQVDHARRLFGPDRTELRRHVPLRP